jgi:hypothetical protein
LQKKETTLSEIPRQLKAETAQKDMPIDDQDTDNNEAKVDVPAIPPPAAQDCSRRIQQNAKQPKVIPISHCSSKLLHFPLCKPELSIVNLFLFRLRSQKFRLPDGKPSVPPDQLLVKQAGQKGEGAFTLGPIEKDDFVCEYIGKLIAENDICVSGIKKQKFPPQLETWTQKGNFSFFFQTMNGQSWCIDANETTGPGRKINHSMTGNLKGVVVETKGKSPRIFFKAVRNIEPNEELTYDYGERETKVIQNHPWLAPT